MKIKINSFNSLLNKISFAQLIFSSLISVSCLFFNQFDIFTGLLISALASFSYTQIIKFSSYSKLFALFGFPFRLTIIAIPSAILVHKLHSNLIALFIGFVLSLMIYFIFTWTYAREIIKKEL